ncbi:MAG TPA: hypothetical protein VMN36_07590 [Verrucomicrobiales bacterium]|nr:hypothetical protein [Verrucomicrobiales bacterium]
MTRRTRRKATVVVPGPGGDWEVWLTNGGGGRRLAGTLSRPRDLRRAEGSVYIGVPSQHCRTLSLRLPAADPEDMRRMIHSQLERRGLTPRGEGRAAFEAWNLVSEDGESVMSVDVLSDALPRDLELRRASAYAAAARFFPLPEGRAAVFAEEGRLVLAVGHRGCLAHGHVLSPQTRLTSELGREIEVSLLSLEEEGVLGAAEGVELWGTFPEQEVEELRSGLRLSLTVRERPQPARPRGERLAGATALLPPRVRQSQRRRRLQKVQLAAVLLGLAAYGWLVVSLKKREGDLDQRIAGAEEQVAPTRAAAGAVRSTAERWRGLRDVIEPRRYPLLHLDHVARIMPEGGLVLRDFESKGAEVTLRGRARGAGEAFEFVRLLNADENARLFAWSMPEPQVAEDGSATFEIKGAMR